jgi:hypothetical protein
VTTAKRRLSKARFASGFQGADLAPLLLELIRWGLKYDPKTAAPASFTRRITARG